MKDKVCSKCKTLKWIKDFEKRPDSKDGYRQYCNECKKKQSKLAYKKRLENDKSTFWKNRANDLNKASGRKGIARDVIRSSEKIPYASLWNLYDQNKLCHYCNVHLLTNKIVFDHKTPLCRNGKHHIENIIICCADCNRLKGTRTYLEFKSFIMEYVNRFPQYRGNGEHYSAP